MSRKVTVPPRDLSAPVRVPSTSKPPATKKPSGVYSERHSLAQDPLYQEWLQDNTPLRFTFTDGTSLLGRIQAYDTYALQVHTGAGVTLVFKQSVRWIAPAAFGELSSEDSPPA